MSKLLFFRRNDGVVGVGFQVDFGGVEQYSIAWPDRAPERESIDVNYKKGTCVEIAPEGLKPSDLLINMGQTKSPPPFTATPERPYEPGAQPSFSQEVKEWWKKNPDPKPPAVENDESVWSSIKATEVTPDPVKKHGEWGTPPDPFPPTFPQPHHPAPVPGPHMVPAPAPTPAVFSPPVPHNPLPPSPHQPPSPPLPPSPPSPPFPPQHPLT